MSTGRIYLFHHHEQLRASLERDLVGARFDVRSFATGPALERAARQRAPVVALWDLDDGEVGEVDEVERRVGAAVIGLTRDRSLAAAAGPGRALVMPFERWRLAPRVKELLASEGEPARRRGGRVIADTVQHEQPHWWDSLVPDLSTLVTPPRAPAGAEVAADGGEGGGPAAPVRVLVADDDDVLQHILAYQFEEAGWVVTRALDGVEAARQLASQSFDLVLLDLNLPHRNGFEILETMAPRDAQRGARVVVISEQTQDDKIIRAFALGAHDFVPKPLNPKVVLSRFRRLLDRA